MKQRSLWHRICLWAARKALVADGWVRGDDGKWSFTLRTGTTEFKRVTWEADAIRRMMEGIQ